MEKKKVFLKTPKNVRIPYGDDDIEVLPFLSVETQIILFKTYIDNYFMTSSFGLEKDVVMAEHSLKLGILDLCTSIDVSEISINEVMANFDVYDAIVTAIKNYEEFRSMLYQILDNIEKETMRDNSIGFVLENIYQRVQSLVENLASMDIDDEKMGKVRTLLKEAEDSPILKQLASNLSMGVPKVESQKPKKQKKKSEILQ